MPSKNILTILLALAFASVVIIGLAQSDSSDAIRNTFYADDGSRVTLEFDETDNATLISVTESSHPENYVIQSTFSLTEQRTLTVTSIASGAFSGCSDIQTLTIPSTVASIQGGAFTGCSKLLYFIVDGKNNSFAVDQSTQMLMTGDGRNVVAYPCNASVNYRNVTIPS